ncbi:MAG: EamA family transporter RarD [Sphingomicrobium sp.]|nr:EamA family transporter RarD [Sphingomonadales bacterium]
MNAPESRLQSEQRAATAQRTGFLLGIAAYAFWGVLPIYFKWLQVVPPVSIVAHRICWSLLILIVLVTAVRGWSSVRSALRQRRTMLLLTASAALIAVNWLLYVYAVNSGHILAGSLGYYLNPLANILLGRFFLKEHLSRLQWAAVGIAAAGIAVLAAGALGQLWISLILCMSFASYGFVRKIVAAEALTGLTIETALLTPLALAWLFATHQAGTPALAPSAHIGWLLAFSGIATSVPLLLFTAAARRLPYSTIGMLQFIAPTLQFLVAVFLYGEPFTRAHAIAFSAIWIALALYVAALLAAARRERLSSAADPVMVR